MNGANHRMDCVTTYPFYIMGGDWGSAIAPVKDELPLKGDTVVGNDVWIITKPILGEELAIHKNEIEFYARIID